MTTIILHYPVNPPGKHWETWARVCESVFMQYLPDVEVVVMPTFTLAPEWEFKRVSTGYQSALLGTFCAIMKYIHLLKYA